MHSAIYSMGCVWNFSSKHKNEKTKKFSGGVIMLHHPAKRYRWLLMTFVPVTVLDVSNLKLLVQSSRSYCCNLSGGVALIVWFTTNGMCVKNNTIICVARASNSKRDCEHDLCCCLLPRCEALSICRSGFPIATLFCSKTICSYTHLMIAYWNQTRLSKVLVGCRQGKQIPDKWFSNKYLIKCGLFQGCGAIVKMTQLQLWSSSCCEHGSGSGALGFHGSGCYSFSHIKILIVLMCFKLVGNELNQVYKTMRIYKARPNCDSRAACKVS